MFKLIICIAIAAIAGWACANGYPDLSGTFDPGDNAEARNLVDATQRTNEQAQDLNDSFSEIVPPDTDDPYTAYAHPSEHAVADALDYLERLQTELNPPPNGYVVASNQLRQTWEPRYHKAVGDYKRFAYDIDHANLMAAEYFQRQQQLTQQYNDPAQRYQAETLDHDEYLVYLRWQTQAHATLGQATLVMQELHDLNLTIIKQNLSAHFASLYDQFHALPPSLRQLHAELDKFRQQSEEINHTFGFQQ